MSEQWVPVVGFDGAYEVSSLGRVRSLDRIQGGRACKGRALKQRAINGYMMVTLFRERERFDFLVHRLVAESFIGPRPSGKVVAHWDGVRHNNSAENLRYATRLENSADMVRHGTVVKGELVNTAKLTEGQVREIRLSAEPSRKICVRYGVSDGLVRHIRRREVWGWLNDAA